MNIKSIFLAFVTATIVVGPSAYNTYRQQVEKQEVVNQIYADFGEPAPGGIDSVFLLQILLFISMFVVVMSSQLWIAWYTKMKQMNRLSVKLTKLVLFLSVPTWQFFLARYTDVYKSLGYKTGSEPVWPYAVGLLLFFSLLGVSFAISNKLHAKNISIQ